MRKRIKYILILFLFSYLFFMLGNGILSLTNPDEVFYAQTAKEMMRHHSWMTPYLFDKPQFEKPPFTYWLLRIGFILFGVSSFGARFFPALFAALGVLVVYLLGAVGFQDEKKAFLSGLVMMSCGLYIGLARTVFTDMFFSVFILSSLASFFWGYSRRERKPAGLLLFFFFAGLAVLTKGPLGFIIPFLTIIVFLLIKKDIPFLFSQYFAWGILLFLILSLPWYIFMIKRYGTQFTHEFFYNDHWRRIIEAEHITNDTWYFYPLLMVGCIFPWTLYLAASLIYLPRRIRDDIRPIHLFLVCWIGVTFFIFQAAHSKLVSYILPLFPALALVIGDFAYDRASSKQKSSIFYFLLMGNLLIILAIAVGLATGLVKYQPLYLFPKAPIYIMMIIFAGLFFLSGYYILKGKFLRNLYLSVFLIPIALYAVPFIRGNFEPYISSKGLCEYLLRNYTVNSTILCCKPFVRGVRYYTDREVAVIDLPGKQFFSPHPIPFLDTPEKVTALLRGQGITFCFLKKSYLDDIKRIAGMEFQYAVLQASGNEYLVKVENGQAPD